MWHRATTIKQEGRIRRKLSGTAERPRLTVYKSLKHIYAQVVDDTTGRTLAFAPHPVQGAQGQGRGRQEGRRAKRVGRLIAEKARPPTSPVVFDRNGFPYHGRIAAVAEAAREAGLKF